MKEIQLELYQLDQEAAMLSPEASSNGAMAADCFFVAESCYSQIQKSNTELFVNDQWLYGQNTSAKLFHRKKYGCKVAAMVPSCHHSAPNYYNY